MVRWAVNTGVGSGAKTRLNIPSLDGLRALSFLLVFVAHAGADRVVPGSFGVTVFFFLSGYLITTLLRVEHEKTGTVSLRRFYLRRALRILPPFYIVLVLAVALTSMGLLPAGMELSGVVAQALQYGNYWLINNGTYDGLPRGTGVFWSLAVEGHFYLLFPLMFVAISKWRGNGRAQAAFFWSICGLVLLWRIWLVRVAGVSQYRTNLASDTRFDSLLFGCALAMYGNPALEPSRLRESLWKYLLLPAGLLGLFTSFLVRDQIFRETVRYTLQGVCLVPVFVCAIRYPQWLLMRPLSWAPLAFIGALSYSLYLVHHVIIYLLEELLTGVLGLWSVSGLAFVVSLACSWLLYEAVEKPCAKFRKRLRDDGASRDNGLQPSLPSGETSAA